MLKECDFSADIPLLLAGEGGAQHSLVNVGRVRFLGGVFKGRVATSPGKSKDLLA